jgi:hypothetical protein
VILARAPSGKGSTVRNEPDPRAAVARCWNYDRDLGLARVHSARDSISRGRSRSALTAIAYP